MTFFAFFSRIFLKNLLFRINSESYAIYNAIFLKRYTSLFMLRLVDEIEDAWHDRSMIQLKPLHEPTIRTTHFCARGQIQP